MVGSSWRDGDCSDPAGCDGGCGSVGLVGVECPYLGEIVAVEHAGEEWKCSGGVVEGSDVVVEVGRLIYLGAAILYRSYSTELINCIWYVYPSHTECLGYSRLTSVLQ